MLKKLQEMKKNGKKGFTLVELIVVIAIIIVLMAILIPLLTTYINNANDAKGDANARAVYSAAAAWGANQIAKDQTIAANQKVGETELEKYFGNVKSGAAIEAVMNADGSVAKATYTENGKIYNYPRADEGGGEGGE